MVSFDRYLNSLSNEILYVHIYRQNLKFENWDFQISHFQTSHKKLPMLPPSDSGSEDVLYWDDYHISFSFFFFNEKCQNRNFLISYFSNTFTYTWYRLIENLILYRIKYYMLVFMAKSKI